MSYSKPNTADSASVFHFNSGQRVAVIVTGIIGTISATSVAILLLHLFSVSFISGRVNANKDERIFLRMHLGAFVVCLLCSDLVQGISGMVQLEWARRKRIDSGALCTAQAAMLLFGDNGTAFWNAVVAIHTFWTVVLKRRMSTIAVALLIATGWTLATILTLIGPVAIETPERGPFYSIAGAWCFVTSEYKNERIYTHYLPMLISGFIITVLYVLVAFVLFGILIVDGGRWHFKRPTQAGLLDCFGTMSWGRLGRGNHPSHTQSASHSSGLKSLTGRIPTGSIRLGSVSRKSNDIKPVTEEILTIDIAPTRSARPESGSTAKSDGENPFERGRSSDSKTLGDSKTSKSSGDTKAPGLTKEGKVEVKVAAVNAGQNAATANPTSGKVPLKTLAIKMLWYPIVYLILVMPMAISRVDASVNVSLSVMLGFMCLLWSMGTANTIIYVCTRRLGPTPWSRRNASISRSRSKTTRKQDPSPPNAPVQIFVDRYTQRATDEQFIELAREKGNRNSLTGAEISILDPLPAPSPAATKVGFDFGAFPPSTHHVQTSHSSQTRSSITAFSPMHSPQRPQFEEPHPYARSTSPTNPTHQSHEVRMQYPGYYFEDDEDSLRTQSRTHSRGGSLTTNNIRQ